MKRTELKQLIKEVIQEEQYSKSKKIVTIQRPTIDIDIAKEFKRYKYAIQEHNPIKLSNGNYLHIYRVVNYEDQNPQGDPDEEQDDFEREQL